MGLGLFALPVLLHAQLSVQSLQPIETLPPVQSQPDSIVQITAEAEGLSQIAPEDLPLFGTYWLVMPYGGMAPLPCPPQDLSQPIYAITDDIFLVDQTGGQVNMSPRRLGGMQAMSATATATAAVNQLGNAVADLIERIQEVDFERNVMRAMGMDVPGFGDGGGDGGGYTNSYVGYTIDTNGLWLEITNVSNGWSYLNLHNATNQVYAIWSTTDLLSGWQVEMELWPTDTNCQPFTVQNLDRQTLFVRAQDWTGVTENGNTTPDWWLWKYFGTVDFADTNQDLSSHNPFWLDYSNNIVPTVFTFTNLEVANNYVNTGQPTVQPDITGNPYYVARLVDGDNFSNAVWNTYGGSSVTVNLGLTEGWHDVWIGLRGHADVPASAVWQWKRLKLDFTPPALVITNPANGTVDIPLIQVQGYSPEALSSISYDLSNAAGTVSNQQVLVLNQYYDTNTFEFTTNTFQAFDVVLTNGVNTFTLHATDLAGNVTTLVTNFTLDYSAKTNPPNVQITWPTNGLGIVGNSVTVRGQVDDATVTITAAVTDTNGVTSLIAGVVERDGRFWLDNLPLTAGTNTLTLTATDVMGKATTNSLNLVRCDMTLTLNSFSDPSMLWQSSISVTGTVSDLTAAIWVNGIQGTNNGDGTWSASNVPVTPGGVAVFDLNAIPASGGDPATSIGQDKPTGVYQMMDAQRLDTTTHYKDTPALAYWDDDYAAVENQTRKHYDHSWMVDIIGVGGVDNWQRSDIWYYADDYYEASITETIGLFTWDETGYGEETGINGSEDIWSWFSPIYDTGMNVSGYTNGSTVWGRIGDEHCEVNDPVDKEWDVRVEGWDGSWDVGFQHDTYKRKAQTIWHVRTGGRAVPQQQNLWQFSGGAREILDKRVTPPWHWYTPMREITDKTQITIGGMGKLKADGNLWMMLPNCQDLDVTPQVAGLAFYNFDVNGHEYHPYVGLTTSTTNANLDTDVPEVCVGQTVTLGADWQGGIPPATSIDGVWWHLPEKYVNQPIIYSTNCTTYIKNEDLLTNTAVQCWYVNGNGQPQGCSVRETLHFSNGQSVNIAAAGKFMVYRPQMTQFTPMPPFTPMVSTDYFTGLLALGLGNHSTGDGYMHFKATVQSTDFGGNLNWTQLANRNVTGYSSWGTDGQYWLDNQPFYNTYGIGGTNVDVALNPPRITTATVELQDGPSIADLSNVTITDNFKSYLRFKPTGDAIWVTLGIVNWGWSATTGNAGVLQSTNVVPPTYTDSTDFPEWPNVKHNGGSN